MRSSFRWRVAALVSMSTLLACDSETLSPSEDLLQGLDQVAVADTTTRAPGPAVPGYFHGAIVGYGSGTDSVNVWLANVRVTAHARLNGTTVAAIAAETSSDGNGLWELPILPAGEYAVIYAPGTTSPYMGGYTIATTSAKSAFWTVMLPKK